MVKLNDLQKHELRDWSDEVEEILRTLSEKAQIWRLLHIRNHDIFKRKYYCLIIPVIVLSSITGSANLALGSLATGNDTVVNLVIGALGIVISVISTLNNIFSFQKRKDEHYRSAKDWYRVQRMIDIELSLQKSKRNNVSIFFHLVLQEIERIHEFHPNIRDDVIKKFMKSYKNKKLSIDIPEILTIRKTLIFKEDLSSSSQLDNKIIVEPQNINPNKVPNINPNVIPEGVSGTGGTIEATARVPIHILEVCISRLQLEGLSFTEDEIRDLISRRTAAEKDLFTTRQNKMTPEEKKADLMMKRLGLGAWAVGGTKAVYTLDPDQYDREREQRIEMGLGDFAIDPEAAARAAQLLQEDTFGGGGVGAEAGYDNEQMAADDY